jgi:hypothetical protein
MDVEITYVHVASSKIAVVAACCTQAIRPVQGQMQARIENFLGLPASVASQSVLFVLDDSSCCIFTSASRRKNFQPKFSMINPY